MTSELETDLIDWGKGSGLVPAVVQHAGTREVLMLGYMNAEALAATLGSGLVTFFSRSRQELWRKGESSGNSLLLTGIKLDCDGDTFLVEAEPAGPVCHLGTETCFGDAPRSPAWLNLLEATIRDRQREKPEASHTWRLLSNGPPAAARKLGEEAVELAVAATSEGDDRVAEEAADVLYHLLVLLRARDLSLDKVICVLRSRAKRALPAA
jgi:phosphoribosyl-ATP pyrophosphohydrolase/phosphoribosyl-AMP cyclohydrolase